MRVGLRTLASETVHWLGEALAAGTLSRVTLARELCAHDNWRNAKGELCAASALSACNFLTHPASAARGAPCSQRATRSVLALSRAAGSATFWSRRAAACWAACPDRVKLRAPRGRGAPVAVQAVLVSETAPPAGRKLLDWLLLCGDGEATAQDALRKLACYERRWLIEEYFKVLNCGRKLLDQRLREAASIENCLVFEAINGWKVFDITRLARERPAATAAESFSPVEIEVLNELLIAECILPAALLARRPPEDIQTTVVNLARVAGFRPTKRRPLPSDGVMWKA